MRKNQKGFSVVEGLLLFLIVCIIGFVGWYVWHSRAKTDAPSNDSSSKQGNAAQSKKEDTTPQQKVAPYKLPNGWIEYKNESIGFSFAYPKEWGVASTNEAYDKRKNVAFVASDGQNGQYIVRLHSKDAVHGDTDSPTLNIVGFSANKDGTVTLQKAGGGTSTIKASDVLLNDASGVVYLQQGLGEPGQNVIVGLKSIALQDYQVAIFDYLRSVDSTTQAGVLEIIKEEMASFKTL